MNADEIINLHSTYSIVARDPETGELGVAVQTHQMGVGRLVPWLLPGVGAIATQSLVNVSFGPMGLAMLRERVAAPQVIEALVASDEGRARRQLAVVDAEGNAAAFTGDGCIPYADHYVGVGYSVQANMMTNDTVISAMRQAYETAHGDLAARMMAALFAAQAQDGDIRGMQSAALRIVPGDASSPDWMTRYDLRVDEHAAPMEELARLVVRQRVGHISNEGHRLLGEGDTAGAIAKWAEARQMGPDRHEMAFWQAVALADANPMSDAVDMAAAIFNASFGTHPRRAQWLELIRRLEQVGLIERDGAGAALIAALEAAP